MPAVAARALKQLVAVLFYRSGLLALWWRSRGARLRGTPLIVAYHRVLPVAAGLDLSQAGLVVSTPTFERQLRLLGRLFGIVPLAGATAERDPRLCAITFDDGWADNYSEALPVLRRLALPATLFVTTGLVGTGRLFWPERLAYLLGSAERQRLNAGVIDGLRPAVHSALLAAAAASDPELTPAIDRLIEAAKEMGEEERELLLALLSRHTGRSADGLKPRLLDWSQVVEMSEAGIEIGAHGVTHAILTRVEPSRATAEILEARATIAEKLGTPAASFAYPNGDTSPELARAVRDAGYTRALVTESDPLPGCPIGYAIRRKNLAEGSSRGALGFSAAVFACEVLGLFDWLRRLAGWRSR
jgi:peptidoglycan/xylan/chitin deacetylase (PgdA/CDA1 family)